MATGTRGPAPRRGTLDRPDAPPDLVVIPSPNGGPSPGPAAPAPPAHPAGTPAPPRRAVTAPAAMPARAAVTGLPLSPKGAFRRRPRWATAYTLVLVVLDAVALLVGAMIGHLTRFARLDGTVGGLPFYQLVLLAGIGWLLTLAASRAYDPACLGIGSEEFRRVGNAAARFTSLVAIVVYLLRLDVARGLVVVALPASALLGLALRFTARKAVHDLRRSGRASHRVLVVGCGPSRDQLTHRLHAAPHSGLRVVGTCDPRSEGGAGAGDGVEPVRHVRAAAERLDADTVAVAHSPEVDAEVLRRIAWSLEGSGIALLVAPALTDIAGPRIDVRPVPGVPLLQIAEPEFTGFGRVLKGAVDVAGSLALLLLLSPLLLLTALAVRFSGEGPVLFRQTRIGRNGEPFTILKFRTMHVDAEHRLAALRGRNDHGDGVLFKLRDDPRITPLGRWLRRFSVDELPQLLNVLRGQMSLVGPRPPLPTEVERYEQHVHRRLLVKPGLTGLWQVSGRSDLDWTETVRLDLYYVENWAVSLDIEILWKTLRAVVRGSGAR